MPKIAVITDSDSSLPADLAARYQIQQVPIAVQFGSQSFRTEIDMDDVALFARVDQENKLPTTAAPSPGDFVKAYEQAFAQGADEILCICVSSVLSTTYNSAVLAAQEMPDRKITLVDSYSASMGQGYAVLAAAQALEQGADVEQAVAIAKATAARSQVYGALATLKYLAMSGRVGHVAAGMAGLLSIKPILSIQEGKLDMLEKARTRKRAWQRLIDLTLNDLQGAAPEQVCVVHAAAGEDAQRFAEMVQAQIACPDEVAIIPLTAGLAVHTGAGMVGIAFVKAEA